jgi:hypothetical protein
MATIFSKQIGHLTQNERFDDWWRSEETEIPFFDKAKLAITFAKFEPEKDLKFIEEADNAILNFLKLTSLDRLKISDLVLKNYYDFLEAVGDDEEFKLNIDKPDQIWDFVHPNDIYVSRRPYNDKDIYVQISCDCDWEEEHGLQLIFRQGRQITRVSGIDGHLTEADAYDKPDSEDELLTRFK